MEIPSGGAAKSSAQEDPTLPSPAKPLSGSVLRSASRSDAISTPEKPIELPRRGVNRSLAFSVRQVRRAALDLRSPVKSEAKCDRPEEDSLPVEEKPVLDVEVRRSSAEASIKLPEEYEKLAQFFSSMVNSMRLMRMKRQMCTFSSICPKIEYMTDRRFTLGHLAQLKYILPEAILLKKVLCHDEVTSCMKPDIQISVLPDAIGTSTMQKSEGGYIFLNKVLRTRIAEYCKEHPDGDEIPEAALPEPFNRSEINRPLVCVEGTRLSSICSTENESVDVLLPPKPLGPLHMPPTFQRRFSKKTSGMLSKQNVVSTMDSVSEITSSLASPGKCNMLPPTKNLGIFDKKNPSVNSSVFSRSQDERLTECCSSNSSICFNETPSKVALTPSRQMSTTPEIQMPKRCRSTAEDYTSTFKKSVKRPLSLDEQADLDDIPSSMRFLPQALLLSIKEKKRKSMEDPEANYSKQKRRKTMISGLPKFFDMLLLIFQTSSSSVITKEQLIYKILSGTLDAVDRGEIEEQLTLLQELIPDWISQKTASTGDSIFSVNKAVTADSIRKALEEAK